MAQSNHPNRRPRPRRELKRTSPAWWQDEQPVPRTGSSADPSFDDYDPREQSAWAPGYIGEGNYSSGDFPGDEPLYDYGYGGFKGDAGFDELGDQQYGGGRYGRGPDEESNEYGGEDFRAGRGAFGRLEREFEARRRRNSPVDREHRHRSVSRFPGAPGWRDAADWADPAGFHSFSPEPRGPKNYRAPMKVFSTRSTYGFSPSGAWIPAMSVSRCIMVARRSRARYPSAA